MKYIFYLFIGICLLLPSATKAQLPDGSTAPDWTHTDIFGNQHHLYTLLNQGKMVVIEFSATWCGPCWNYMLTGALEDFWEEHGPNGTNQAQVFYIEADQSTGIADLYGQTPGSQGNWVANIPFPIIDLQVGQNTDIDYQINYYPTLFAVCADKTLWELGQVPAGTWEAFLTSCMLAGEVSALEPAICYGEGSAAVEVSGGNNPITYEWSNGDTGPTLDNVGAGNYSVSITEAYDKFVVLENIIITGQEAPISVESAEIEDALCFNSSTGNISIELAEGTPPFSYDWSNGATTQNLVNVPADDYIVTATDANGCEFISAAFTVEEPEEITAEATLTPDFCDQDNGTITLAIEGGVGGYVISASEGSVSGNVISDLPGGNVDVEIEDTHGCLWTESYDVEEIAQPEIYFSPNPSVSCAQPIEEISGFVQNGSGEYEYQWTAISGHIVGASNQQVVQVDQPGEYELLIYDLVYGCDFSNLAEVSSNIELPIANAGVDTAITCENLQLTLGGSGDSTYTITWSTIDGHIVSGGNTYTPLIDAAGTYTMSVFNPANSCSTTDEVLVPNNTQPAAAGFSYQSSGLVMIGTDASTGSNLSGWLWDFGDGNTSTETNIVHTFPTAGTYQVCHSVTNGCGANQICQAVEVTFVGSVISAEATIGNVLCNGNATGSIVLQINGGSGVYTYLWTGPGGATYTTPSLTDVVAGTYQLVITDDVGNLFIGEYSITEPTAVILATSTVLNNLCFGQALGALTVDVTGGVGPYTYSFNGGPSQAENFIANQSAGNYECMVTDANGCIFNAGTYTINEPAALQAADIQVVNPTNEENTNGSISLSVTGGIEPYTITWSNGATGDTLQGLIPGSYTYLITDANGCTLASADPIILTGTVSTLEPEWARHVSIRPNPSEGNVVISWEGLPFEKGQLSLITPDGIKMTEVSISTATGKWDLSSLNLASGIYIVRMESDGRTLPFKVIVIH